MKTVLNVINWLLSNNHLVAWVLATIASAWYRLYSKNQHDARETENAQFIVHKAKEYAHVVNGNDNIPLTDVKAAIISGVREAVDAYNANTKTRHISVTDEQISHAADIAIDYYKRDFGGFTQAKSTAVLAQDIEQALIKEELPTSVATINNTSVASSTTSSAASASTATSSSSDTTSQYIESLVSKRIEEALADIAKGVK